ncbi:MAG TPA: hypothetical protein VGV37_22485 [Aliidongia sp.]|uniref:hypothetical protein n=1 Tax=Aliidongia sp. TaxID=1914230 RepID=UPI002DDDB441|nr:hypothetical protein [Aliidongia sp.]HEV2677313.1 hypothetical protein [Aliidongia sp.]
MTMARLPKLVSRLSILPSISLAALLATATPSLAKTIPVGPNETFKQPSEAIAVAADGDTLEVAPGQYYDCAIIRQKQLTIVGTGPDVVLTDRMCEGKGLLIARGNDLTIRNLTFTRARVADLNGAGIRLESGNLTVDHAQFINNETGILADDAPRSTIRILNSVFDQNGRCDKSCSHGIFVGRIALLNIEHTRFFDTHDGHHIKSRALRTELIDDDIEDGPRGTSSYLVEIPNGGSLIMQKNRLEKGPHSTNLRAAIMIDDEEKLQITNELTFFDNYFVNDTGEQIVFALNWSETDAVLNGNIFKGDVTKISSKGYALHKTREFLYMIKGYVLQFARAVKHLIAVVGV